MNRRKHKNKKLSKLNEWWDNITKYKIIDNRTKANCVIGFDVINYNEVKITITAQILNQLVIYITQINNSWDG